MIEETYHGKVVAKKEGLYTVYVFQKDDLTYDMCTKLPNWGPYSLNIGDSGFVTVDEVIAGEPFYNRGTMKEDIFQFSNRYFKEFIADKSAVVDILV